LSKYFSLALSLSIASIAVSETPTIVLLVGQSKIIETAEGARLVVSKKKVLDLYALEGGRWQVTALKLGFVILSWEEADGKMKRLFVRSIRPLRKRRKALQEKGPELGRNFRLKGKVVLMDKEAMKQFGIEPGFSGRLPLRVEAFSTKIHSMAKEQQAKIIGEPMIRLIPGIEATLNSGGEFQVMYDTTENKTKEGWKTVGLQLTAKLLGFNEDYARVEFLFSLKSRSSGTRILANGLSSVVDLKFGEEVLVGQSDMLTDINGQHSSFSLAHIPILGPIFRIREKEALETKLLVSLVIESAVPQQSGTP